MPIREEQKTNKQHAVPQNIMDVEFKLIGDLTMRQFIYLIVFAILAYGSYVMVPTVLRWVFVLFFVAMGLGLAFIPLQERGLDQWIINFFGAVYAPNQRVWKKDITVPTAFDYQNIAVVKQELITLAPTSSRRRLEEYLETQGPAEEIDKLDIPEQAYIKKIKEAFAGYERSQKVVSPPAPPPVQKEPEPVKAPPPEKAVSVSEEPEKPAPPPLEKPSEEKKPVEVKQEPKPVEIQPEIHKVEEVHEVKPQPPPQPPEEEKPEIIKPKMVFVERSGGPQIVKSRLNGEFVFPQRMMGDLPLSPITPDQHTGRRFVNLAPGQGRLVLPLRTKMSSEAAASALAIEEDIGKKAEQLRQLMQQVRSEHKDIIERQHREGEEVPPEKMPGSKEDVQVGAESARLYEELESLRKSVRRLTEEKANVATPPLEGVPVVPPSLSGPEGISMPATFGSMKPLTDKPNIISGVVKRESGDSLENVFIVIKNYKGEPVRALKTNALGQFAITTPLTNGEYIVEIDTNKKTSLAFDIISLELKGEVLPPVEVTGR